MVKNVLLGFITAALAVASAASSYNVTFYEPVTINGAQLKPGDYKLELKDDHTAVLKQGKMVTETLSLIHISTFPRQCRRTFSPFSGGPGRVIMYSTGSPIRKAAPASNRTPTELRLRVSPYSESGWEPLRINSSGSFNSNRCALRCSMVFAVT